MSQTEIVPKRRAWTRLEGTDPHKSGTTMHVAGLVTRILEQDETGKILSLLVQTNKGENVRLYGEGLEHLLRDMPDGVHRGDQISVFGKAQRNPYIRSSRDFYIPEKLPLKARFDKNFLSPISEALVKLDRSVSRKGHRAYAGMMRWLYGDRTKEGLTADYRYRYLNSWFFKISLGVRLPTMLLQKLFRPRSYGAASGQRRPWEIAAAALSKNSVGSVLRPYTKSTDPVVDFAVSLVEKADLRGFPVYYLDPSQLTLGNQEGSFLESLTQDTIDLSDQISDMIGQQILQSDFDRQVQNSITGNAYLQPMVYSLRRQREFGVDLGQRIVFPYFPWTFGGPFSAANWGSFPENGFFAKKPLDPLLVSKFAAAHETGHALSSNPYDLTHSVLSEEVLADSFAILAMMRDGYSADDMRQLMKVRVASATVLSLTHNTGFVGLQFVSLVENLQKTGDLQKMSVPKMVEVATHHAYFGANLAKQWNIVAEVHGYLSEYAQRLKNLSPTEHRVEVLKIYQEGLDDWVFSPEAREYVTTIQESVSDLYYHPDDLIYQDVQSKILETHLDSLGQWIGQYGQQRGAISFLGKQISSLLSVSAPYSKAQAALCQDLTSLMISELEDAYDKAPIVSETQKAKTALVSTQAKGTVVSHLWDIPVSERVQRFKVASQFACDHWEQAVEHAPSSLHQLALSMGDKKQRTAAMQKMSLQNRSTLRNAETASGLAQELAASLLYTVDGQKFLTTQEGKELKPIMELFLSGGWQDMHNQEQILQPSGEEFSQVLLKKIPKGWQQYSKLRKQSPQLKL